MKENFFSCAQSTYIIFINELDQHLIDNKGNLPFMNRQDIDDEREETVDAAVTMRI